MKGFTRAVLLALFFACKSFSQVPENLLVEGIPPIPETLKEEVSRYLEFRSAAFNDWHPMKREVLISTRFADTNQLHQVAMPGGARKQLTFFPDRVGSGLFQPINGNFLVFPKDTGGNEFFQLYRFDLADGKVTLLTDGKARNLGVRWSSQGKWLAYTSTRRNGKDNDIYLMDPSDPESDRLLTQVSGGGWEILDWSPDDARMILMEHVSANESYLYLADATTGLKQLLTPKGGEKVLFSRARFAKDGQSVYVVTDRESEFQRLMKLELSNKRLVPLTSSIHWDVEEFELSPDGKILAFITNEGGAGVLHLFELSSRREIPAPHLPQGIPSNLKWHSNGRDLAFNFTSARSPADVFSVDIKTGKVERWTESETGGLNTANFTEAEVIEMRSFDGLQISAFVYRPDRSKFPGKRPVIIIIHGGPEAQFRPAFQSRSNYLLDRLGIALVFPNVRGSSGYGKTFLTLDNGFKREDPVKDVGTVISWIEKDPWLDSGRIAVYGGSYGGYMTLASMTHFNDRLRAGIDVVGISNFVTFLKNTQDYRRDLRRAEYGDERDEAMYAFLERISPLSSVQKITKPLLIVQGKNDPRVPVTESEQMVKAIRGNGVPVWYLMATDEGHGFAKKRNLDFEFYTMILFLKTYLLN